MKFNHAHLFFLISLFLWGSSKVSAQCNSPVIFNSPGEFDFFVPAGVNSLVIEVWGAGGGGGGRTTSGTGGGGGGGAYSRSEINVIPGSVYTVSVGAGGLSNINGEDSWVALSDAISNKIVLAKGGQSPGEDNINGGLGGSSANGIGTFRFSGGNGAIASLAGPPRSGGGGSSAGVGLDGNPATDRNGATAPSGGGNGGNGSPGNGPGENAPSTSPGGGAGGARGAGQSGGEGSGGRVVITYTCQFFVGGTLVDDGAITGTTIIEFGASGVNSWTAPKGLTEFEVFVVGGGGGGGSGNIAGGGGAGGVTLAYFTNINSGLGFVEDTEFEIIVGTFGRGTTSLDGRGTNGGISIFGYNNLTFQTAAGGGIGGASSNFAGTLGNAIVNGSGGGVNGFNTQSNGNGTGNNGAQGINENTGGGGGGAVSPGTRGTITDPNPLITATGGNGGDGFSSDFRGNTVIYAAGGGGTTRAGSNPPRNISGLGGSGGVGGNANNNGDGSPGSTRGSGGGAGSTRGGDGNSGVVIIRYPNLRLLPVEYLYFDANFKRETKSVDLKWATAKEWENSHFEIQRSLHGVKNWEVIGKEPGVGWSDDPVEYLYNDDNLPLVGGLAYYRLLQVDLNGNSNFSKTISVRLPSLYQVKGIWRAFPNPNNGSEFNLELVDEKEYNGEDLRVRLITPYSVNSVIAGSNLSQISRSVLEELQKASNGIYILEISWGQKIEILKIMKH